VEEEARQDILRYSHAVHRYGWVANHDGNLSVRLEPERILATPTAMSKADVTPASLIVVDREGKLVAGTRNPFSELQLHLAAYESRPDISAVVHAHPPTATAFAVAGHTLPAPFIAEAVVSIGADVPLVPYHRPGHPSLSGDVGEALWRADVVLLENHGILAVGPSLELCVLRIELVEHLCKIALTAQRLGGAKALPEDDVQTLLAKRAKAGLGPPAQRERAEVGTYSTTKAQADSAAAIVEDALRRWR
jgi:L-fuculose-phosphate aldolase